MAFGPGGEPGRINQQVRLLGFNPANLAGRQLATGVTATASKSTVTVGFTAGAGLDIALMENVFLRAEYQYAWFDDFNGHKFNVNTVRGGVGVKF